MQRFDLNQIPHSPWKNGGGSTREIVCFPPGAGMDSFAWRISVATIAQAGPFSAFAGIDRQIMLLDGDGVQLVASQAGIHHALQPRWQPFAFSGDVALDCTLLGGTSTDFNVMTRRGQWSAAVQVISAEHGSLTPDSPAGLCMVLDGRWKAAAETLLEPGQGLWWSPSQPLPKTLTLTPQQTGAHLVWVSLTPSL
ncbi:HutD family protein [Comamonas sp.]|uniref:HutD/Ves family protein n=1 Tax=Comamonas sp. TaxID=34028 RepID=UPI003A8EC038